MSTLKIAILSTFALDFYDIIGSCCGSFPWIKFIKRHDFIISALVTLILAPEFFLPIRDFSSDYHATLDGKTLFKRSKRY